VLVVIVIASIVVLVAVVFLSMGRGGELSAERNDYVPLDLGPVTATDVVLLRPPTGLWGYNMQATDEAMEQIAESIRERDVRIVALEQLVTDLNRDHAPMPLLASPYAGARHRRMQEDTVDAEAVEAPQDTAATESAQLPFEPEPVRFSEAPRDTPATEPVRFPWELPRPSGETEPVRLPFDPSRPTGEMSGPPPELSHD
jgi:hypothetical protein